MNEVKKSLVAMVLVIVVPLVTVFSPLLYDYDYTFNAIVICKLVGFALSLALVKSFGLSFSAGKRPIHGALLGSVIGIGTALIGGALIMGLHKLSGVPESASPLQIQQAPIKSAPAYMGIISMGILAPIFEESLLRIFLAQQLRRVTTMPMAIFISSFMFALIHGFAFLSWHEILGFLQVDFLPLLLGGVVLGTLYFKHGWLAAMAAHAVGNITPILFQKIPSDGPNAEAFAIGILLLVSIGLVATILLFLPKFRKGVRLEH